MAKVLSIHVNQLQTAGWDDPSIVKVRTSITLQETDEDPINLTGVDFSLSNNTLGVYKTAIQLNADLVDAVKTYLNTYYSIPTSGYSTSYLSGGWGLLSLL